MKNLNTQLRENGSAQAQDKKKIVQWSEIQDATTKSFVPVPAEYYIKKDSHTG